MIAINSRGYFITGSDTDVGKTYIACELIRQLRLLGIPLEVRKPAESGCKPGIRGELFAADASKLEAANEFRESNLRITPNRFQAALAPHRAAILEGKTLCTEDLMRACILQNQGSLLIVEGAGGFYSPICEDGLNADLAGLLKLDVFVVVDDRIGAVNQALMTLRAVESRQLEIAAVILNRCSAMHDEGMNNSEDLRQYCHYPIFSCAYEKPLEAVFKPGQCA